MLFHPSPLHLSYCTNIHPADGWPAVFETLRRYGPALKARLSPDAPFALGLRLSARDARELTRDHLQTFRRWLDDEGLYVPLINGFPFGAFHRTAVKADVYAPDWRDPARQVYTSALIDILAAILPAAIDGGVSTAPLSYKDWMRSPTTSDWDAIVDQLVATAAHLARVKDATGRVIHLDIEPEPDCVLENTDETIAFFEERLWRGGASRLATVLGTSPSHAADVLREHIGVCFDCCHFAVEFEDPRRAIARLVDAGIRIGRVQLSSALDVHLPADGPGAGDIRERLRPFADSTYLHQVVERAGDGLTHFPDLDPALASADSGARRNWRIHFHVPLFTADYGGLGSTQRDVRTVIDLARATGFTRHLEIETYTWDVLPDRWKVDLLESIAREYEWVLGDA